MCTQGTGRRHSLGVLALTLVLVLGLSWAAHESVITVNIDTAPIINNELTITVPRVSRVVLQSTRQIQFTSEGDSCDRTMAEGTINCSLALGGNRTSYSLILETSFNVTTGRLMYRISIIVEDNYRVGCSEYVFPVQFTVNGASSFTCVPVFVDELPEPATIQWLNFTDLSQRTYANASSYVINETLVELSNSSGVLNSGLRIKSAKISDAGYYVPYITLEDDTVLTDLTMVFPIVVTYEPVITNDGIEEFSYDLYLNPNVPQNFTYSCEVDSFPMATIVWRFKSTFDSEEANLTIYNGFRNFIIEDSRSATNGMITIVNLGYENSGIYTCFAENPAFMTVTIPPDAINGNGRSLRIRVKDHLRPLWPAVGLIGVAIVVPLLMLCGTLCDKCFAKRKSDTHKHSTPHRPFSVSSSGSPDGAGNNVGLSGHSAVRRMSSAKVQLLEESTNV